jgi:hypothetical protein
MLDDYTRMRNSVTELTLGNPDLHKVLTGAAIGDAKVNSSFKKARVSYEKGMDYIDELCDLGVIELESSMQHLTNKKDMQKDSQKIAFTTPFLRFWFAFISPIFKNIKAGNYKEFETRYNSRISEFHDLTFNYLSCEYLKYIFADDEIVQIGAYWDDKIDIDIVAKTKSGKIIAGSTKYINSKLKTAEYSKLKQNCEKLGLNVDAFVIFAKKGFSSELKSLKSEQLRLFTSRSLSTLVL